MKLIALAFLFLFVLPGVLGADLTVVDKNAPAYASGEAFTFRVQVYENGTLQTGASASCNLDVTGETGETVLSTALVNDSGAYAVLVNNSFEQDIGTYPFTAWCNTTGSAGFLTGHVEVTGSGLPWAKGEDLSPAAALILLPFLLMLVMLVGAVTLDPIDHASMKIGLFVMSFLPFFISVWWGIETVGRFYNFPALSSAIADTTFYYIVFFILIIFYIVAYFIWRAFDLMAQNKKERLKY